MTTIGFLACETTLPGSGIRRDDAYEHDLMIGEIEPALAAKRLDLRVIDWEAPLEEFAGIDLLMLGTAWNYQDRAQAFLARLEELESQGIAVCNPPSVVRWNITKTYLRKLAERGARTIPTLWLDRATPDDLQGAFERFDCEKLVVKRQVGAGAEGQELLVRGTVPASWTYEQPAMIQPFLPAIAQEGELSFIFIDFLPAIAQEGELSFIFIDGALSHTLRKRAAEGDYRIQSLYGGRESLHEPSADEVQEASAILAALPFETPLYARIDMLRGDEGLLLMEAELIEPYLYPEQGLRLGERLAAAIGKRLKI